MFNIFKDNIIITRCNYGQPKKGVEKGGDIICSYFNLKPHTIIDNFDDFNGENGYYETSKYLVEMNKNNKPTLLLGGDHSISISSVDAMLKLYGDDLSILWIDAHADINDYSSTLTGNLHGMPLGFHFEYTYNNVPWNHSHNQRLLKSNQLYYLGIRDLDDFEVKLIHNHNIDYSNYFDDSLKNYIDRTKNLMISFDVDALDPLYLDSTGTLAKNGLHPDTIKNTIKYCISKGKLVHLDITELNPDIGDIDKSLNTLKNIFL